MEKKSTAGKKKRSPPDLASFVFSWSLKDICNENLYGNKVASIPTTFSSVEQYFKSFCLPLLEETRADLSSNMEMISRAPAFKVLWIKSKKPSEKLLYDVRIRLLTAGEGNSESYVPKTGDVLVLSSIRPKKMSDLESIGGSITLASVIKNENYAVLPEYQIKIQSSRSIAVEKGQEPSLFAVYLSNITTNSRIWLSITSVKNLSIIQNVLNTDSLAAGGCNECSDSCIDQSEATLFQSELNESQKAAISNSLSLAKCSHKHRVQLVWGPPGTGKTKTISTLLWALVGKKHRTVTCAPTNIAVVQIASRLLNLIKASRGKDNYLLGDVVLYGNRQKMKIKEEELEDIFLDDRVEKLAECFNPRSGWNHQLGEMINLLQNPLALHKLQEEEGLTLRKFLVNRTRTVFQRLKNHFRIFSVNFSTAFTSMGKIAEMVAGLSLLESFLDSLRSSKLDDDALKQIFGFLKLEQTEGVSHRGHKVLKIMELGKTRLKCIQVLEILKEGIDFPVTGNMMDIRDFCLAKATVVLCTAATSFKLRSVKMGPLELCVIDEASQLKECESLIPLQLKGLRNAILIGDDRQLSAMVNSKVSEKADFGRSLFQRLVSLGQEKELLAVQYRMHPSISLFPNSSFYSNKIRDGDNVKSQGHRRRYLKGNFFGSYSFINIAQSAESSHEEPSRKNLIEVAVVSRLVQNLSKACRASKKEVSVGIISPYAAQVAAISEKLGKTYDSWNGFRVKIRTVDGFQGGEEDIIIFSTVRANKTGNVGFLSNLQRTNVALTRAKYCLWILGNEPTLVASDSIWKDIVIDAKQRRCFFDAEEDESLADAIVTSRMELGQFDDMLRADSLLFRKAKWKVLFTDSFRNSILRTKAVELRKVVELLKRLSNGKRQEKNELKFLEGSPEELLQKNHVGNGQCLFWSTDIEKSSNCIQTQVLKFWAFLPQQRAPKLEKRLKKMFSDYPEEYVSRCKFKRTERGLVLPMSWEVTHEEDDTSPSIKEVQDLSGGLASIDLDEEEIILYTVPPNSSSHSHIPTSVKWMKKKHCINSKANEEIHLVSNGQSKL
ncbi:hypothetical protein H6P81_018244 [Aristolochia fimbriata]|uniref:Helicase MAGATAMA 3 n=1 Tax=Aristolochia fimbriata TaxID=158543 RepID=A0AAV7E2J7_ARIFI|nr:hypothetical protein H6P81_018244 [Aristolochia fimbriata]